MVFKMSQEFLTTSLSHHSYRSQRSWLYWGLHKERSLKPCDLSIVYLSNICTGRIFRNVWLAFVLTSWSSWLAFVLTSSSSCLAQWRPRWTCLRSSFVFRAALRPQKPYGLLGTGEEWDRGWEPRPTSLFTQLLRSAFVLTGGLACLVWQLSSSVHVFEGV